MEGGESLLRDGSAVDEKSLDGKKFGERTRLTWI